MVNCVRFSWIIVGFFILTKLLAYSFYLEDSLIIVIQKHPNSNNFYRESSSLLLEICVLFVNLSEISCANYSIIIYYEDFLHFFPNQFFQKILFFSFWRKKIRRHLVPLINGVLQGLVKIYFSS